MNRNDRKEDFSLPVNEFQFDLCRLNSVLDDIYKRFGGKPIGYTHWESNLYGKSKDFGIPIRNGQYDPIKMYRELERLAFPKRD